MIIYYPSNAASNLTDEASFLKQSALKDKIALTTKSGPGAERRNELKAELDQLRAQQGDGKTSRDKIVTQLKSINESVAQKV